MRRTTCVLATLFTTAATAPVLADPTLAEAAAVSAALDPARGLGDLLEAPVEDHAGKRVGEIVDVHLDLDANRATQLVIRYDGRSLSEGQEVLVAFTDGRIRDVAAPDRPRRPRRKDYGGDDDAASLAFVVARERLESASALEPAEGPTPHALFVTELLGDDLVRRGGGGLGEVADVLVETDGRLSYLSLDDRDTRLVAWEYVQVDLDEDEVVVADEAPIEGTDRAAAD